MQRCLWAQDNDLMQNYHDNEWCKPSHDDRYIFEMLTLEGAQAGLSWQIILNKRTAYQEAFANFDIKYCASLSEEQIEKICTEYNIVRNRNKVHSVRSNALLVQKLQEEYGSFAKFLWRYVANVPVDSIWPGGRLPAQTPLSEQISSDLKKLGFKFVGPVIIYSFMQAIGLVNDHEENCFCRMKK